MKKNVFIIILVVIILGMGGYLVYDKVLFNDKDKVNNNDSSEEKKSNNIEAHSEVNDDIYGYAYMEYLPGDGSFNEYYKIVELHKNSNDNVLASYDVNKLNSINKVNKIGHVKMVDNKLYYQLYYNSTDEGILTYNNIMYIDLNSENKEPIELLNWKQDSNNYSKTINNYKINGDYLYFDTFGTYNDFGKVYSEYYKYNIQTKELTTITAVDFESIVENQYTNDSNIDKLYLNGKELSIDKDKLMYDGKTIYNSNANEINLLYSFNDDIIINEMFNCSDVGCNKKFYKYNFEQNSMEEIDPQKNQVYTIIIWYK